MKNCPHKPKDMAKPIVRRCFFHLDEPNVVPTLAINLDMLSIHDSIARALIDTSATNSFVSSKFVRNLLAKLTVRASFDYRNPSKSTLEATLYISPIR